MKKITLRDCDVYNKKVLIRADFNVPMKDGKITDDNRIKEAIPTIKYVLDNGGAVVLMSHLGRPDGKIDLKYSLKPVADRLAELLDNKVIFASDTIGEDATLKFNKLNDGEVLLLENLRFDAREEENDKEFSIALSKFGDLFVFDAFGTAHRKHASTYGVAKLLPNAIGFLVEKELKMISGTMEKPKHPFVAILGGAKISDKIGIVNNLIDKCDSIVIGGGMAFTFLKALNFSVGKSLCDDSKLDDAKNMIEKAKEKGCKLVLPVDFICSKGLDDIKNIKNSLDENILDGYMGLDIGKQSIKLFTKIIKKAKTVIWNGPMGVFEVKEFSCGTYKIAKALTKVHGTTIVGGGDSAAAIINMGLSKKITHISTGGGASLELIEGKTLPGIDIISSK